MHSRLPGRLCALPGVQPAGCYGSGMEQSSDQPTSGKGPAVRTVSAVVPSLRVDVLGAKGFKVSRSYFAKGVAGGKVSVNGKPAGKSSSAGVGDRIEAQGLGVVRVLSVDGETRRGNLKVSLEVET